MSNSTLAAPGAAFYTPVAEKRWTDKRGYAEHTKFCERTIGNLIKRGLPCLKIGKRRVRIDIAEADAWMRTTFGQ